MRIISGRGSLAIALLMLALFLRGSALYAAAYTNAAGTTVIVPNDADSPYTLAKIASNIANPAVFSYNAVSCIADLFRGNVKWPVCSGISNVNNEHSQVGAGAGAVKFGHA